MDNHIYICCKQPDCINAGAPYFISQEERWLKKILCPVCGEMMEPTNNQGSNSDDKASA